MIPQNTLLRSGVRHLQVSLLALMIAAPAFAQEKKETPPPANAPEANTAKQNAAIAEASKTAPLEKKEEPLKLSPFTVTTNRNQGYFAANTLAGSRMNTNLADLASSISVVTKQQMEDTASIDVNDVFRYEVNTEGSGTYTPATQSFRSDGFLDVNAGGTQGSSTNTFTNSTANRVRGIGVPSSAINYYPAISSIPMDSYNVSSVEISRGPNSMLFGLGSPAGIVNQTTSQAVLNKSSNTATLRFDQYGSYRGSFAFNRSLIDDKLAIYGAFLYDDRQFDRKPSYDLTRRQYGAFTFKPFSKTTFSGFVEGYTNDNRRPNTLTPRDFVTQWNLAGQPWYDAMTRNIYRGNQVVGNYVISNSSPYAQQVRDTIRSLPGYNPALRGTSATANNGTDTNFTFYNGIGIFGDAALTTSTGFVAGKTPSNNILFVPGITRVGQARTVMQIADGQVAAWFQPLQGQKYQTQWTQPPAAAAALFPPDATIYANTTMSDVYNRDYMQSAGWTAIGNGIVGYKYPGVTDKSIYDWTNVNINQMNFGHDKNVNYNLEFTQDLTDNLYFNAGWFRQDFDSQANYTVAQLNVATLFVDTSKYRPDGSLNPYFGKPYVSDQDPDQYINAELDDHYRAMLAWTPDFTQKSGWMKWLGHHQILGLWSRDDSMVTTYRRRLEYLDSSSNAGKFRYMANQRDNATTGPTGWNYQTTSLQRFFYLAAPTDPNGVVTRSSGTWDPLQYSGDIKVYDYANGTNGAFDTVNMTTVFNDFDAGTGRAQRQVDSLSGGWTAYLWQDRLIGTFGVRQDKYKARVTNTGNTALTNADGTVIAPAITNAQKWVNGFFQEDFLFNRWARWDTMKGTTRTLGGVLRPFQHWNGIDSRADQGSLWWQFVRDFGVSYNQSDNFNPPATTQVDPFGNPLPKPQGTGKDYGFQFSLLDNKLFARVTWFENTNENERIAAGTAISRLTDNVDQTLFRNWARTIVMINMGMDPTAPGFGTGLPQSTEDAVQAAAAKIWQLPYNYYQSLPATIGATRNAEAKGVEAEINYNPTRNWTIRFTFGHQDTKYSHVLGEFDPWFNVRNPVWQAAKAADYLLPQYQGLAKYTTNNGTGNAVDLTNFWTSYGFNSNVLLTDAFGNTNVQNYYNINVTPQVLLARDLDGQSAPEQRKNRFALTSNYSFSEGALKGFNTGGSVRWEDKAVIGYYGKASGANGTQLDVSDTTKPIYDDPNYYVDLWVGYARKIAHDKVKMKIQLNVVNVFESGGLQTVGVNYDGSPYAFRIVDPRQFILTTSFDF